ncbi:hypothetical protein VTJ49DRAFT_642 [Mycothermus thermophilus]|uniref:Uncharacterized protein n=1 Tax=Humicola insolens TaxID=85995 RepID=A0ABR3VEH2_HUMIN
MVREGEHPGGGAEVSGTTKIIGFLADLDVRYRQETHVVLKLTKPDFDIGNPLPEQQPWIVFFSFLLCLLSLGFGFWDGKRAMTSQLLANFPWRLEIDKGWGRNRIHHSDWTTRRQWREGRGLGRLRNWKVDAIDTTLPHLFPSSPPLSQRQQQHHSRARSAAHTFVDKNTKKKRTTTQNNPDDHG